MITTVTLNPMLDKTVRVASLTKGLIHRAKRVDPAAGGKGINVARQLAKLGVNVTATGFLGGETGIIVRRLLDAEAIPHEFVETGVMTREGVTYLEDDGTSTAVFEPSGHLNAGDAGALSEKIRNLAAKSSWIVCSGSSPGDRADGIFREAIHSAREKGKRSVLDSYGNSLKLGAEAVPTLLKPNRPEYEETFGVKLSTEEMIRKALDKWVGAGITYVIITDGPGPTYAAAPEGHWKVETPEVRAVNPVGSGDAMVAGLVYGLEEGWSFERCLGFGVAAGAANAMKWEAASSTLQEITAIESRVTLRALK